LLAGLDIHAGNDTPIHLAADRRDDSCVLQIQLSLIQSGALLLDVGQRGQGASMSGCDLLRPGLSGAVASLARPAATVAAPASRRLAPDHRSARRRSAFR
jgi:hypothetical protein